VRAVSEQNGRSGAARTTYRLDRTKRQIGGSGLSWNHGKSRAVRAMPSVSDAVVTVCDAPSGDLGRAGVALALNGESGRLAAWHFQGQHISIWELGAGDAGNQVTVD
jgi:hypothetical protein